MKEYVVVRDYSSFSAKNTLWKVLSRPMSNLSDAVREMRFLQTQEGKCKSFRVVNIELEDI